MDGWEEDFVMSSGSDDEDEDEPLQVIGVRADPTNGESWDSDFDFSDDEALGLNHATAPVKPRESVAGPPAALGSGSVAVAAVAEGLASESSSSCETGAWGQLVAGLEALLATLPPPPTAAAASGAAAAAAAETSDDEDWDQELAAADAPLTLRKQGPHIVEDDGEEEWEKDIVIEDSDDDGGGAATNVKNAGGGGGGGAVGGLVADDNDELVIEDSDDDEAGKGGAAAAKDREQSTAREQQSDAVPTSPLKPDPWNTDLENHEAQLSETQSNGDKAGEVRAHRDIANLYKQKAQWHKALASLKAAHKLVVRMHGSDQTEAELLYEIGETARSGGDMLEAEEYLHKALEASHKLADPLLTGRVQYQLGLSSAASHRPLRATVCFSNQLKSLAPTQDWDGFAKGCLEIGKILKTSGHTELARSFLDRAVNYALAKSIKEEALALFRSIPRITRRATAESDSGDAEDKDEADNESESESDWEAELNLSDSDTAPSGRKLGLDLDGMDAQGEMARKPTEESVRGTLPPRYKLNTDDDQHVEIQKFPKPTFLYSLRTKEGESYLHERELVSWLETIVTKRPLVLTDQVLTITSAEFCASVAAYEKFSEDWVRAYTDFCCTAYAQRKREECWATLRHFFGAYDDRKHDASATAPLPQEVDSILLLVNLAAKMWTDDKEKEFAGFLKAVRKFLPQAASLLALIHTETHSHHGGGEKFGVVARFLDIYQRTNAAAAPTTAAPLVSRMYGGVLDNTYLQAIALTDLHLHLNYISPLTTLKLQSEEATEYHEQTCTVNDYQSDGEMEEEAPMEGAEDDWWADEDGAGAGGSASGDDSERASLTVDVFDSDVRAKELQDLYLKLPLGWYKAKAAYALGNFYVGSAESAAGSAEETALGERLLFEAVYILDRCPNATEGCSAIASELGTNALLSYAAVLMRNYKYIYAIRAYHSALVCLHLRNKRDAYYSLLHQLAEVSRAHNDHPRSLDYLHQMLQKYTEEGKINEILYVSDMLSKQYSEIGLYTHAEAHIQMAYELLEAQGGGADARKLRVVLDAATLYLESGQLNRAIELLSHLILLHQLHVQELGREKYRGALTLLAEAYIKKRWFAETQCVLDRLAKEPLHPFRPTTDTAFDPGMRESSKYWHLRASNYLQGSLHGEALACVDLAIRACSKQSLGLLGRYYYLRGKILQEIIRNPPQMPTTLPAPNLDEDTVRYILYLGEKGRPTVEPTLYTCPGDVLQEAVSSLDRAYDYFLAVGDDLQLSKTLSRIAEVYLDHLFVHVALLRVPYEERARLTSFSLSDMARKPGTMDDEEEEGKDVFISFDTIEGPAETCLDICAETCNVMLMLTGYMNMAELRYLQDSIGDSLAFWRECKDQFLLLFMDGSRFMADNAPPTLLGRALQLVKRLLRFMLCFDVELINKNLMLIDAYLLLERELEQTRKRSYNLRLPTDADAPSALAQVTRLICTPAQKDLNGIIGHKRKRYPSFTPRDGGNLNFDSIDDEEKLKNGVTTPSQSAASASASGGASSSSSSSSAAAEASAAAASSALAAALVGDGGGAWGKLRWIKNCINKYVNGRMSQEEMLSTNRASLRALAREQHQARLLRRQNNRQPLNGEGKAGAQPVTFGKKLGRGVSIRGRGTFMRLLQEKRSSSYAFNELIAQRPALSQLVYMFVLDNALVAYVPASGKKRIQQLAGRVEASGPMSNEEKGELPVSVHLMVDEAESVNFTISPGASLDALLRQLYAHRDWQSRSDIGAPATTDSSLPSPLSSSPPELTPKRERSTSGNKHNKFGSVSKALQLQPRIQFRQASAAFYPLFQQWLEFFGQKETFQPLPGSSAGAERERTPMEKVGKRGHRRSKSSTFTASALSNSGDGVGFNPAAGAVPPCVFLAKRVYAAESGEGAGSGGSGSRAAGSGSGFVPLSELMKSPLSDCFSAKEIATATQACPLRLYLYFADSAPSLTHLTSPSAGAPAASRKICFSEGTLAYLASLVSHPPPPPLLHKLKTKGDDPLAPLPELAHSALGELTSVFSSVLEIMPASGQSSAGIVPVDLPVAKSTSGFFSARFRRFTSSSSHGLPAATTRAISATPPVLLVCNGPLQIIPWELLLHDAVVRSFSLHGLLHSPALKPRKLLRGEGPASMSVSAAALAAMGQQIPRFVLAFSHLAPAHPHAAMVLPSPAGGGGPSSALIPASPAPVTARGGRERGGGGTGSGQAGFATAGSDDEAEGRQVEWVVGNALHGLRVWPEGPVYGSEAGFGWPHACALTATPKLVSKYRKKLRSLAFVDLAPVIATATATGASPTPSALAEAVVGGSGGGPSGDSVARAGEWSVCLMAYGELVDGHPLVTELARRGCTLLFVPPSHVKEMAERLSKLGDALRASRMRPGMGTAGAVPPSLPYLLLAAMSGFHEEFLLPIAIINPPSATTTTTAAVPSPVVSGK